MKSLPAQLLAHYREPVTRLATLWRIHRRDGQVMTLTDHDAPITYAGDVYSPSNSATPTAIVTSGDMTVDNGELASVPGSGDSAITLEEQLSGLYDGAEVRIFRVCYEHPEWGAELLKRGWLGSLSTSPSEYKLELRGLVDALQKPIGVILQPTCRADLGDYLCGVDLGPYTITAEIDGVTSRQEIASSELAQPDDYYLGGRLTFLTGANGGLSFEVRHSTTLGALILATQTPRPVAVGDQISIHAGCDRTLPTCRDRFNNLRRYCGEPCINPDRYVNPAI